MVVRDLHVVRSVFSPPEVDLPLAFDPNAGLTGPVYCERLEPIAAQACKVSEGFSVVQDRQSPYCLIGGALVVWDGLTSEEPLGLPIPEASYRLLSLT